MMSMFAYCHLILLICYNRWIFLLKEFLRQKFQEWYSNEITKQLDKEDIEAATLEPINMCLPIMKELGAHWLFEMAEYIVDTPKFIVNGFIWSGISKALDGERDGDTI